MTKMTFQVTFQGHFKTIPLLDVRKVTIWMNRLPNTLGKSVSQARMSKCVKSRKMPKFVALKKQRQFLTSRPATDTMLVLSNQCILYEVKRDK